MERPSHGATLVERPPWSGPRGATLSWSDPLGAARVEQPKRTSSACITIHVCLHRTHCFSSIPSGSSTPQCAHHRVHASGNHLASVAAPASAPASVVEPTSKSPAPAPAPAVSLPTARTLLGSVLHPGWSRQAKRVRQPRSIDPATRSFGPQSKKVPTRHGCS